MDRATLARLLAARGRKRTRKKAQGPRFPRAAEAAYVRELVSLSREISALIEHKLLPFLKAETVRLDAADTLAPPQKVVRVIEGVRIQVAERVTERAPVVAARMTAAVGEASRKAMNATVDRVVGVTPWSDNANLRGLMQEHVRTNVALIQSIGEQQLDQVQAVVAEGLGAGLRSEEIATQLRERFDVSASRAKLIARDQVGKINADLNRERAQSAGITTYTWQTSHDERVRPMHADLDGKTFAWNNPPVTNRDGERNHPGEDILCRCNAISNIEDFLTSLGI